MLLAEIKSRKIPIADLLNEDLAMEPAAILANVLVSIHIHTTTYQGTINKLRRDKKKRNQ